MTAIIRNNFRIRNAKDFLENFSATEHDTERNLYLFIAKSRAWTNELSPDAPADTLSSAAQVWHEMLGCKKVAEAYTSLVIKRYNWDSTGNTVYVPFSNDDADMFRHPTSAETVAGSIGSYTPGTLYVVTDDMHIFKCLNNNFGAKSTIKPTLTLAAPYIVNTADGYSWKYMATVSASQSTRFLTDQWLPVKTLGDIADDGTNQWDVEQNATDGTIDSVILDNKGSGYQYVHTGTFTSGSTASNTAILAVGASATVNAYVGASVYITGGTGYPATTPKLITAYNSATREITISGTWTTDATTTYIVAPTITQVGDGSGCVLLPVVQTSAGADQYKVTGVTIVDEGTGYRYLTATLSGCGGSGAIIRPQVAPKGGHGFDIERELGAFYACLNARLSYGEGSGDFPVNNDYRQIGLIRDLKNYDDTLATADTRIATKKLSLTSVSGDFESDELITGISGAVTAIGRVLDFDADNNTITYVQDSGTGFVAFSATMALTGAISAETATVSSVTNEEIKKFEGDILYQENRRAVVRSEDQIEDIKVIVEF